jgi:hypothetical protein
MRILLEELKARGEPAADDQSIASQLYRVMRDHPEITEDRVLSEIGILFVEGFETTGALLLASGGPLAAWEVDEGDAARPGARAATAAAAAAARDGR